MIYKPERWPIERAQVGTEWQEYFDGLKFLHLSNQPELFSGKLSQVYSGSPIIRPTQLGESQFFTSADDDSTYFEAGVFDPAGLSEFTICALWWFRTTTDVGDILGFPYRWDWGSTTIRLQHMTWSGTADTWRGYLALGGGTYTPVMNGAQNWGAVPELAFLSWRSGEPLTVDVFNAWTGEHLLNSPSVGSPTGTVQELHSGASGIDHYTMIGSVQNSSNVATNECDADYYYTGLWDYRFPTSKMQQLARNAFAPFTQELGPLIIRQAAVRQTRFVAA